MVEENQKLFEPPVTELGKSLMMDSFTEHLKKSQAPCFSTLQKLSLWRRKGVMGSWHPRTPFVLAQHWANPCLRWWHLAPSATKLLAWVSMHTACCQCKAWSSATWEEGAHYTVKIVFISPKPSISHATGKNISFICSFHYFKKHKNGRSLIHRILFLHLLPF